MSRSRLSATAPTLGLLLWACTTAGGPQDAPESPVRTPPQQALVYVRGTTLEVRALGGGSVEEAALLPSADVAVSLDGLRYAVVEETDPAGPTAEGFSRPGLLAGPIDGEVRPLGPGRSPMWSPRGTFVAAIAQEGECSTGSTTCGERLVVYDIHGELVLESEPAAAYSLMGWLDGDSLLALAAPGRVVVVSEGGVTSLDLSPAEVWGSSPASDALLVVADSQSQVIDSAGHRRAEVELGGSRLGDGTWSPDGTRVAAVALEAEGFQFSSRLVLIEVATGEVTDVPGSNGAQGQVVWSADGTRFAYVRSPASSPQRLQAVECEAASPRCDPVFSWRQGVTLLALR